MDRTRNERAVGCYECAARLRPYHSETWYHLGVCWKRLGRSSRSRRAFCTAFGLAEGNPRWGRLVRPLRPGGDLLSKLNELQSRLERIERSNNAMKEDSAHVEYAEWCLAKDSFKTAILAAQLAIEMTPGNSSLQAKLEAILGKSTRRRALK